MPNPTNGQQDSTLRDRDDPRIGSLVAARYRVERLVGRGGMASVYAAHDTQLGREVALKIFRPELADRDDMRRHEGEVGMLAALNHPGLVTLFDAVADEVGGAVLVLEFIDGGDLRAVIDAGAMAGVDVALIGAVISDALAYSHDRGIVHRDIKPANILVPTSGAGHTGARAKLADFGIARLIDETRVTAVGSVLGTAHYLSPEQALGTTVGPASDVYSLGLVLLEALTGQRPHPGSGVETVAARLSQDPTLPEGLRPDWVALLRSMTDRNAEARPSAAEAADRLRLAADDPTTAIALTTGASLESTQKMPAYSLTPERTTMPTEVRTAAHTSTRTARRRPVIIAAAVASALLLTGVGLTLGLQLAAPTAATAPTTDPPAFPDVGGTIGEHLRQLQQSVAP
jgi:serine/threonine protein kinase